MIVMLNKHCVANTSDDRRSTVAVGNENDDFLGKLVLRRRPVERGGRGRGLRMSSQLHC